LRSWEPKLLCAVLCPESGTRQDEHGPSGKKWAPGGRACTHVFFPIQQPGNFFGKFTHTAGLSIAAILLVLSWLPLRTPYTVCQFHDGTTALLQDTGSWRFGSGHKHIKALTSKKRAHGQQAMERCGPRSARIMLVSQPPHNTEKKWA
jgi:hypothetical protein